MIMVVDFEDWERVVFRDENASDKFIEEFLNEEQRLNDVMLLVSVHWNSCTMKVVYVLDCGQHCVTEFSIQLWEDYYNQNK